MSLLSQIKTAPIDLDLPAQLAPLQTVALNAAWRRDRETRELFRDLDPALWDRGLPPMRLLMESENLIEKAGDPAIVQRAQEAEARLHEYLASKNRPFFENLKGPVAYFCAEYGVQSRIALYCGGLGILAGDHCMEASDMGFPFVAIGLFYRRGFFKQLLDRDGRQQHVDPIVDPTQNGLQRVLDSETGTELTISVEMPGRTVHAAVWLIAIGNVPLLLMDTDLPENSTEDRLITSQLYTVGREMRLCQEAMLGVGGVRVLEALNIKPSHYHLNEGHSALLLLERLRTSVASGQTLAHASKQITGTSVLTIHTPVPEGNERFDAAMARAFVDAVLNGSSVTADQILKLGLDSTANLDVFDMTAFALRLTHAANGVSLLHGKTADKTWREVAGHPVIGVTNGVHMPTWIGPEMRALFENAGAQFEPVTLGQGERGSNRRTRWSAASSISDRELWESHKAQKRRFIEFAKRRFFNQHARYGEDPSQLKAFEGVLNPDALIIGFSRRFATYKRAGLVFSDEKRLAKLLNASARPVQIVFSGKAYPTDRAGQDVLAKLYRKSQSPKFRGKIFILEDYDMEIAEKLVQGVDVWLNNPRRPLEASGTSGMKAAANGVPNASILDGWWDEAYEGGNARNGFAIGGRKAVLDEKEQDAQDASDLYRVLEEQVVPTYFQRNREGLPEEWLGIMKNSIADSLLAFSTRRMIDDYLGLMYEK